MRKLILVFLAVFSFAVSGFSQENQRYYVGIYLSDISGFDLNEGRFRADLYVWCKWAGSEEVPPLRYANGEIETVEELERESDGVWRSVKWRIQGTFRGKFPLHNFPFDRQRLKIRIELDDRYGQILPDLAGSGMAEDFSITGWLYDPYFKAEVVPQQYHSDFGSISREGQPQRTHSAVFLLDMRRPIANYMIKFVLPLLIVIGVSLVIFFTDYNIEANLGLGVTALLTCTALHFSQADSLPNVSYMVTADKFFIASYLLILVNIVIGVYSFNLSLKNRDSAKRFDRIAIRALVVLIVLTISVITVNGIFLPRIREKRAVKTPKLTSYISAREELTVYTPALKILNTMNLKQGLIHRGLYYETESGERTPFLVEKAPSLTNELVRFLPDGGAVVRWRLRSGLRWGDKTRISVKDLVFSLGLFDDTNRSEIRVIDKNTVDVYYRKKMNYITESFTVYPEKYFREVAQTNGIEGVWNLENTNPPPMDGPYFVEEFRPGEMARFRVNPYFNGRLPAIKVINVKVMKTNLAEYVKHGENDIAMNLSEKTFREISNLTQLDFRVDRDRMLYLLQPDAGVYPFNSLEFRQALAYALPRDEIRRMLNGDRGVVADSYRPADTVDYNPDVERYPYDPARARQIFARYPLPQPVRLMISQGVANSPELAIVKRIRDELIRSGLPTEIEIHNSSSTKLFSAGNHGGLLYVNRDSEMRKLTYFWHPTLVSEQLKEWERKFDATLYPERQEAISRAVQAEWAKELPLIPLTFAVYKSANVKKLVGWKPMAVEDNIWWNVEDWYFQGEEIGTNSAR